jgi:hypothetical protein
LKLTFWQFTARVESRHVCISAPLAARQWASLVELKKTEEDHAAGRIEALDWEDAKKELRKRFEKRRCESFVPLWRT